MDRVSTSGANALRVNFVVSIPRSGWIVFQPKGKCPVNAVTTFQSLVRDGSCFNLINDVPYAGFLEVSIPRSGWIVFQRVGIASDNSSYRVSIPRSGWIVFQLSDNKITMDQALDGFNPSFGMDRVSTFVLDQSVIASPVSIPRSGWIVFQPSRRTATCVS